MKRLNSAMSPSVSPGYETGRNRKRVLAAIGSRANYSSLKSAIDAISKHNQLELEIVAYSTAVLDRYGDVSSIIELDGYKVNYRLMTHVDGENLLTMAKSSGLAMADLAQVYQASRPDYVLVVGDRYEVLPAAMAAAYMNIRVAHTMGGELTGTIDESVRHAITKLSHLHFPATEKAAARLMSMGEDPAHVYQVGCPRLDLAARIVNRTSMREELAVDEGVGANIDLNKPFILVSQHPVTTEFDSASEQMNATLQAVSMSGLPAIVLWPNSDAGGASISSAIRKAREKNLYPSFRFVKNLKPEKYMSLMARTSCLVGNSSSGIREGGFLGTPVVNVGSRQTDRETGENVSNVQPIIGDILAGIEFAISHGRFEPNTLYGDGTAGLAIASALASAPEPPLQKRFFEKHQQQ
jgi:UDP-hydrolysing UDP-N-acetyl-D-glucosamine 2-epimerase